MTVAVSKPAQTGNAVIPVSMPVSLLVRLSALVSESQRSRSEVVASAIDAMLRRAGR